VKSASPLRYAAAHTLSPGWRPRARGPAIPRRTIVRRRFDAPGPTRAEDIEALLDEYYRGLLVAVARSRSLAIDPGSIRARVGESAGGSLSATVQLHAFTSGEPLTIHLELHNAPDGRCLRVAASASSEDASPVWSALRRALACVPCAS
jgi:hypothetical protein